MTLRNAGYCQAASAICCADHRQIQRQYASSSAAPGSLRRARWLKIEPGRGGMTGAQLEGLGKHGGPLQAQAGARPFAQQAGVLAPYCPLRAVSADGYQPEQRIEIIPA